MTTRQAFGNDPAPRVTGTDFAVEREINTLNCFKLFHLKNGSGSGQDVALTDLLCSSGSTADMINPCKLNRQEIFDFPSDRGLRFLEPHFSSFCGLSSFQK